MILLLIIHLWCLYMYETWSWHTYSYAFDFLLKIGCDRSGIRAVSTVGRSLDSNGRFLRSILSQKKFLLYPWPLWWIISLFDHFLSSVSLDNSPFSPDYISFALHYFANVRSSTCLFIYFRGSLPEFDHTSPLMYDFLISSSSPPFDMLVKLLLKILLTHFFYLSFLCFIHNVLSASPFFPNKYRSRFIP